MSQAPDADIALMHLAEKAAWEAAGVSSPNPPVGAVVVRDGVVIGSGHTQPPGEAHAEVMALRAAGAAAEGATLVCTLEPCSHTGRTPPCTQAIIAAGIARVVFAVTDPDPVAGGGADILRSAGVQVTGGIAQDVVQRGALRPWLHTRATGHPWVSWKVAQSLDGQIAAADGSSRWISGEQSRADVHLQRARIDAIIVGAGTVRADNPQLTARSPDGARQPHQPLRVVLSSAAELPETSTVFDSSAPTLLVVGAGADEGRLRRFEDAGVAVWRSPRDGRGGIDVRALTGELARRGVLHALVEGGPATAAAFLAAGVVNEVIAYLAPKLLLSGMWPALRGYGVGSIDEAIELQIMDVSRCGADLKVIAELPPQDSVRK